MNKAKAEFAVVGLGVMGQGLARNLVRNQVKIVGYDQDRQRMARLAKQWPDLELPVLVDHLEELLEALEPPRQILLLVPAGQAVDAVLDELKPFLKAGDILIDGGNSHFLDTQRRQIDLVKIGVDLIGMGISGGEEGALNGPSLMPGGDKRACKVIMPVLTKIAATTKEEQSACVSYMGTTGAGHFVKMVHNGIEYAEMQLIAECYDILCRGGGMAAPEIGRYFAQWNENHGASYLLDISARVLQEIDPQTSLPLVDVIRDRAGQKGTGRWTSQSALELGVAVPTITAAVDARIMSSMHEQRLLAASVLGSEPRSPIGDPVLLLEQLEQALLAARIISYAQGFDLLQSASAVYGFGLDLGAIARVWRAGCILRSPILNPIATAFDAVDTPTHLLVQPWFKTKCAQSIHSLQSVLSRGIEENIPMPAMMSSLAYYDSYRSKRLPANLIQAQRDYFGSHGFERIDQPGWCHGAWYKSEKKDRDGKKKMRLGSDSEQQSGQP